MSLLQFKCWQIGWNAHLHYQVSKKLYGCYFNLFMIIRYKNTAGGMLLCISTSAYDATNVFLAKLNKHHDEIMWVMQFTVVFCSIFEGIPVDCVVFEFEAVSKFVQWVHCIDREWFFAGVC